MLLSMLRVNYDKSFDMDGAAGGGTVGVLVVFFF